MASSTAGQRVWRGGRAGWRPPSSSGAPDAGRVHEVRRSRPLSNPATYVTKSVGRCEDRVPAVRRQERDSRLGERPSRVSWVARGGRPTCHAIEVLSAITTRLRKHTRSASTQPMRSSVFVQTNPAKSGNYAAAGLSAAPTAMTRSAAFLASWSIAYGEPVRSTPTVRIVRMLPSTRDSVAGRGPA